jgi:ParB family chromosome partitioning protein
VPLRLESLAMPGPAGSASGQPLLLPLESIDEDPQQPRREFDADSLREIAASIAEHGMLQPVSVRPHPLQPDRWMINFGARRLRGARLAGLCEVPAFIDERMDSYRQVVENEQRENLKPLELAMFVKCELDGSARVGRMSPMSAR